MHRRGGFDVGAGALVAVVLCAVATVAVAAFCGSAGRAWAGASDAQASTAGTEAAKASCFSRRNWRGGWRATPDARTIYIRVSGTIYRLDLQSSYSLLKDPFAVLSNQDSAEMICTPLDFRLTVSNRIGGVQSPIVKRMTALTPAQAASLPKRLRP